METIKQFGLGYSPSAYTSLYKYLSQKGYSDELLLESGLILKSQNQGMMYDRFAGRVIYPIFDASKKVIAFGGRVMDGSQPKYLNSPENILFNKSNTLYGLHIAKNTKSDYFILVEGYMDVIAMHQAGFDQTVASLGTAFTPLHAKILKRYTKQVVVLYDSDNAGKNATLRAIPILRGAGLKVKVLQLQGGKDPDEYLKQHTKEEVEDLIKQAPSDIWFKVKYIESGHDMTNPEERVKFFQETALMLSESGSSIEQSIYIDEICKEYNMDVEVFKAEMNQHYKKVSHSKAQIEEKMPNHVKNVLNNEVLFLATLYHYPQIGKRAAEHLTPNMFAGKLLQDLAGAVFEALKTGVDIDMNYFTAKYPDAVDQNIISHVIIFKDKRYEEVWYFKKWWQKI